MDKVHSTPLREAKVYELGKLLIDTATNFVEKIPEASETDRVIIVGEALKDAFYGYRHAAGMFLIADMLRRLKEKPPGEKPEPESPGAPG